MWEDLADTVQLPPEVPGTFRNLHLQLSESSMQPCLNAHRFIFFFHFCMLLALFGTLQSKSFCLIFEIFLTFLVYFAFALNDYSEFHFEDGLSERWQLLY